MDSNINIVTNFYSSERIIHETIETKSYKKGLKIWEKDVTSRFFPEKVTILDIGCGTGREAFSLYDMGFKVVAVDISDFRIETANKLAYESNRNIEFLLTNGLDLPFESNTFDIVIIWAQTFGLFYGEENQSYILKECKRVLKNNGIISFSGHDKEFIEKNYPQYLDGKKFFAYADTDCYWEVFTINELEQKAQKEGFEVLECQYGVVYSEADGPIIHCECRK